jgi:branched-chain amino acid transport system permease protein
VTLREYLSDIVGGWVTAIIGVIFVACVLSFRRGIVGELAALRVRRLRPMRREPAAPG